MFRNYRSYSSTRKYRGEKYRLIISECTASDTGGWVGVSCTNFTGRQRLAELVAGAAQLARPLKAEPLVVAVAYQVERIVLKKWW